MAQQLIQNLGHDVAAQLSSSATQIYSEMQRCAAGGGGVRHNTTLTGKQTDGLSTEARHGLTEAGLAC
jgi:hypothetical protein